MPASDAAFDRILERETGAGIASFHGGRTKSRQVSLDETAVDEVQYTQVSQHSGALEVVGS